MEATKNIDSNNTIKSLKPFFNNFLYKIFLIYENVYRFISWILSKKQKMASKIFCERYQDLSEEKKQESRISS